MNEARNKSPDNLVVEEDLEKRIADLENQLSSTKEQLSFYYEFYQRHKDKVIDNNEPQGENPSKSDDEEEVLLFGDENSQAEEEGRNEQGVRPLALGRNLALEYTRDSPAFRCRVEAFAASLAGLRGYLRGVTNEAREYISSGRKMRQAGAALAAAVSARSAARPLFTNALPGLGRLGENLSTFAETFVQLVDGMNIFLDSLEQGFLHPIETFMNDETLNINEMKKKVWGLGDRYEVLLQQVLDGKKIEPQSKGYEAIMDARWDYELGRFELVRALNVVDCRKKLVLETATNAALYAAMGYFQGGTQLLGARARALGRQGRRLGAARRELAASNRLWANVRLRLEAELAGALPPPGAPAGAQSPVAPRGALLGPGAAPPYLATLATEVLTAETQLASHRDTRHARDEGVLKQGYLHSRRSVFGWSRARRWYRLHGGALYAVRPAPEAAQYGDWSAAAAAGAVARAAGGGGGGGRGPGWGELEDEFLCDVRNCTAVARPGRVPFCFLVVNDDGYRLELQAENEDEMVRWISAVRRCRRRFEGVGGGRENGGGGGGGGAGGRSRGGEAKDPETSRLLEQLLEKSPTCAECGMDEVDWVSVNIGVSLCSDCASVHRNLGVRITQLKSVMLDNWSKIVLQCHIDCLGNAKANNVWEHSVPEGWAKPAPGADAEQRHNWISAKYQWFGFVEEDRSPPEAVSRLLCAAAEAGDVERAMWCIAHKADVNWRHPEKNLQTPLHISVIYGHRNCTAYLLLNGADLYIEDQHGHTAIHMAGRSPLKHITRMFVERERGELW